MQWLHFTLYIRMLCTYNDCFLVFLNVHVVVCLSIFPLKAVMDP